MFNLLFCTFCLTYIGQRLGFNYFVFYFVDFFFRKTITIHEYANELICIWSRSNKPMSSLGLPWKL